MLLARASLRVAGGAVRADARSILAKDVLARRPPIDVAARPNTGLVVGGLAVAAGAMAAQGALQMLKAREEAAKAAAENPDSGEKKSWGGAASGAAAWFDSFGRKHYEGPFEAAMTRREAALILGVRESATAQRIKDAHRRILRINNPDMGGSAFLSAKVNEAKELLIKGKEDPMDKKRG